jgi:CDP-glucose 4,6-dehydratase
VTPAFEKVFEGKRVLVTGHTGFCGSWLSLWLSMAGARVSGLALPPETQPNHFDLIELAEQVDHHIGDIRELDRVRKIFSAVKPEIVFHLAAQPLVRRSYREPVETFATNTLGTAHVLQACRETPGVRAIVAVTTDKVYRNADTLAGHREADPLGGKDPYSASKSASEHVITSYRESFFSRSTPVVGLASARGGNIVGGGDWAEDRLIPDLVRAIVFGRPVEIRHPKSRRPWQHVLCLCHGYLELASRLLRKQAGYADAWNFGPDVADAVMVEEIVAAFSRAWKAPEVKLVTSSVPEAEILVLDSNKAREKLGWRPAWDMAKAIERTALWYARMDANPKSAAALSRQEIEDYRAALGRSQ